MTDLLPGFADPVADSQSCFRAVLGALSRPGRLARLHAAPPAPPPLDPATAAVLLTLADAQTPVWLDAACQAAAPWLAFHAGAPVVGDPAAAQFVVARQMPDLARLDAGSDDAPELSATLILQVGQLGAGREYILAGPGLAGPAPLRVTGLPADFGTSWAANHARYPRGIDLLLCAGSALAALARSTCVTES